jgi:colanic acid/amylovoran biosynthesis glycosyltransferase
MSKFKVAIYSGEIPSTTFIERLITGLSKEGTEILLFGIRKHSVSSRKGVAVICYNNQKWHKLWHFCYFNLLLFLFKTDLKRQLDTLLKQEQRYTLNTRLKCYPVLWHQPDIFHVQWAKGIADWLWVQDFGIKLVLSLRGAHINYSPIADNSLAETYIRCFPKLDGFHAVSEAMALEAQKYGAKASKIKVVYSGLNLNELVFKTTCKTFRNGTREESCR